MDAKIPGRRILHNWQNVTLLRHLQMYGSRKHQRKQHTFKVKKKLSTVSVLVCPVLK